MEILAILIVLGVVVFSMMLHELAHGLMAYWLGDETAKEEGRLSLNPAVHLDPVMSVLVPVMLYIMGGPVFGGAKPVPVDGSRLKWREYGMALVALAGPMMNFLLALAAFLIGHYTELMYQTGTLWEVFFFQMVMANLGFMVFNLIPLPPLDGSRILYALAPDGVRRVMQVMESAGLMLVFLLVMVMGSVLGSVMSWGMKGILQGFFWLVGM